MAEKCFAAVLGRKRMHFVFHPRKYVDERPGNRAKSRSLWRFEGNTRTNCYLMANDRLALPKQTAFVNSTRIIFLHLFLADDSFLDADGVYFTSKEHSIPNYN